MHALQGLKVAVLEGHDVGGTCVNRGCVPSKALLAASGRVRDMKNAMHLKSLGIKVTLCCFVQHVIPLAYHITTLTSPHHALAHQASESYRTLACSNGSLHCPYACLQICLFPMPCIRWGLFGGMAFVCHDPPATHWPAESRQGH